MDSAQYLFLCDLFQSKCSFCKSRTLLHLNRVTVPTALSECHSRYFAHHQLVSSLVHALSLLLLLTYTDAGSARLPIPKMHHAFMHTSHFLHHGRLVSIDFNHNPASSIFDATQTKADGKLVKVMAWYDNEWGFSNRMLDTTKAIMAAK